MTSFPKLSSDHLTQIRQNTDWRRLFDTLQITKDPKKSRDHDWWGKSPFSPDERTASFHINDRGWYCHSTGQGGGAIELVQRVHGVDCYEAGRWLIKHGVSQIVSETRTNVQESTAGVDSEEAKVDQNQPIRQDLRPQLDPDFPVFAARGIPAQVLRELGAGYLERPPRNNGRPDPMNKRLVFQIRGLAQEPTEWGLHSIILGHIGRATTPDQEQADGKWWTYAGFKKRLELYNADLAVLEREAIRQAAATGHVIIVEGCFDVAKLRAAGIYNVVATLGAHFSEPQATLLDFIARPLRVERFLLWYDRDQDGKAPYSQGALQAGDRLARRGYYVETFDWNRSFSTPRRPVVPIPEEIADPAEFSVEQLRWLRKEGLI